MKKYITIAALLAVGSVFANAADYTTNLVFSAEGWTGSNTVSVENSTVWNVQDGYELKSWELSFTFNGCESANRWGSTILATGKEAYGSDYHSGFQIRWNNGATNKDGMIYVMWGNENGQGMSFDALKTQIVESVSFSESQTLKFSLSYLYDTREFTVSVFNSNNEQLGSGTKVLSEANAKKSFYQLTNATTNPQATVPTSWAYSDLKGSVTTSLIPEPSAFGLLAGLGALALVGARRRRR